MSWQKVVALAILVAGVVAVHYTKNNDLAVITMVVQGVLPSIFPTIKRNDKQKE